MKILTAEFVRSAHHREQFPRDGLPEVAFVGRSNVGKSSLLNRLLRRRGLARTGSTPGRTRAVNYFQINRSFYFVDLPGYGFARASKSERQRWAELMSFYFERDDSPNRLVVQLIDGKVGPTALDREAQAYSRSLGLESLIVATKIDKVSKNRWPRSLAAARKDLGMSPSDILVPFSAVTGEGTQQLWQQIADFLAREESAPPVRIAHGAT